MYRTHAADLVISALMEDPSGLHFGNELVRSTRIPSGTVYKMISRMAAAGWLEAQEDPHFRRGRRIYYRVTEAGRGEFTRYLAPR